MFTIEMGVHDFLNRAMRSGSIKSEITPGARAMAGSNVHSVIASKRPEGYVSEVPVRHEYAWGEMRLVIRGRLDGFLANPHGIWVEELKSTYRDAKDAMEDANPVHLAQLQIYHHFLCCQFPGDKVTAVLTYVNVTSLEEAGYEPGWGPDESRAFFEGLALGLLMQEAERLEWIATRDLALRTLEFPFPDLRGGQETLVKAVTAVTATGGDLLVEAATGIGKTMGALYPAVKGLAEMRGYSRVFYLTAKSAGVEIAQRSLRTLAAEGARLRVVQVSSKERMCLMPGRLNHKSQDAKPPKPECDESVCPLAKDFFNKLDPVRKSLLQLEHITSEDILKAGKRGKVCPFELSLELTLHADVIICDYNYAFDPSVYLRRFFMPMLPDDSMFIVDEAHNLVTRGRDMYSAELSDKVVEEIGRLAGNKQELLFCLGKLLDYFMSWNDEMDAEGGEAMKVAALPKEIGLWLSGAQDLTAELLMGMGRGAKRSRLMDLYYELAFFSRASGWVSSDFAIYTKREGDVTTVRISCLNPGPSLRERVSRARVCTFISATLHPFNYYKELLGARPGCSHLHLPSPFPQGNKLYLHVPDVPTKFTKREGSRPTLARVIAATVAAKPGNYMAFFPSFAYQAGVWAELMGMRIGNLNLHTQKPGMDAAAQNRFLEGLTCIESSGISNLGLVVMGGLFGEGVDLPGDKLIGTIIVGPALPPVNRENELIREYFEERFGEGFFWAYVVPGMVKVIQAAGRVFRTPKDKGVVVLVDDRFLQLPYKDLLPEDWGVGEEGFSEEGYTKALEDFWSRHASQ